MADINFYVTREGLESIKLGVLNKEYSGFRGYNETDGWGGGGLLVTTEKHHDQAPGYYPEPRTIVTPFAHEVGWLVTKLWNLFAGNGLIDHCSKIEFLGRLGVAAHRYQEAVINKSETLSGMLYAISGEASQMLAELQRGSFRCFTVVLNNELVADQSRYTMNSGSALYFAYGSNIDAQQMAERCPGAKLGGKALLDDYCFLINSRGVATVVPDMGKAVYGLLWKISATNEASLDEREGVRFGTYTKQCMMVIDENGQEKLALTYVASNSETGSSKEGYLEKILSALSENDMPVPYVDEISQLKEER